jgi:beta-lactamase regulating signal transducer with metallopeptidase domain
MSLPIDFAGTIAIDALIRVTVVLGVAYLLAVAVRRQAAIRHAVLLSGLAAAIAVVGALLVLPTAGVPRWHMELPTARVAEPAETTCLVTASEVVPIEANVAMAPVADRQMVEMAAPTSSPGHQECDATSAPLSAAGSGFEWRLIAIGLAALWFFGACAKTAGLAVSVVRLQRIVAQARLVEPQPARSLLTRIQRSVGLRQTLQLLESPAVPTPIAAGIVGNYVLLPAGRMKSLSRSELCSVLCHEAAHLARRDHRTVILEELMASVFWFHPLVHFFNRALNQAREEICDNYAIASINRPTYCEALCRLASGRGGSGLLGATSMSHRHWPLEQRIRGILDERRPTLTRLSAGTRFIVATIALLVCGLVTMPEVVAVQPSDQQEAAASADADADVAADARVDAAAELEQLQAKAAALQAKALAQQAAAEARQLESATWQTAAKEAAAAAQRAKAEVQRVKAAAKRAKSASLRAKSAATETEPTESLTLNDTRTLPDAIRTLVVETSGDIRIEAAQDDQLHIEATLLVPRPAGKDAARPALDDCVQIATDQDSLRVSELEQPGVASGRQQLSLAISLPRTLAIRLKNSDGDINVACAANGVDMASADGDITVKSESVGSITAASVDGDILVNVKSIQGNAVLQSSDGDVSLSAREIKGNLKVETSDGDVQVELSDPVMGAGNITLHSSDGLLQLKAASAKSVEAKAGDGDIQLHFTGSGAQQGVTALAGDGSIELIASKQVQADVAMMTGNGAITTPDGDAYEVSQLNSGNAQIATMHLGAGGASYRLNTGDGDIRIRLEE